MREGIFAKLRVTLGTFGWLWRFHFTTPWVAHPKICAFAWCTEIVISTPNFFYRFIYCSVLLLALFVRRFSIYIVVGPPTHLQRRIQK